MEGFLTKVSILFKVILSILSKLKDMILEIIFGSSSIFLIKTHEVFFPRMTHNASHALRIFGGGLIYELRTRISFRVSFCNSAIASNKNAYGSNFIPF